MKRGNSAGAGLGVGAKAGGVLLYQAVQRRLLGAVTFVVEWDAMRRPLGLPADGFHARLPRLYLGRSQAARRASIAQSAACLWVPTYSSPPFRISLQSLRAARKLPVATVGLWPLWRAIHKSRKRCEMREDLQSSINYAGGRSLADLKKVNYVVEGGENAGEHLFM